MLVFIWLETGTSMKKIIIWVLVAVMLFVLPLSGCGKKNESGNEKETTAPKNTTASTDAKTETSTMADDTQSKYGWQLSETGTLSELPLTSAKGTKKLVIAAMDNYDKENSYNDHLPVWDAIQEKTGIEIEWDVTPPAQYGNSFKIRIAAGMNMPDIFRNPDYGDLENVSKQNAAIAIDKLIDEYAPNTKKLFEMFPDAEKYHRYSDGKIYGLRVITSVGGAKPLPAYTIAIRKDWLAKLGLQEPRTIDEFYNILKAFRENDPNGNGINDEIPFTMGYQLDDLMMLGNAWGLHTGNYSYGLYPDEKGKLQYEYIDPRLKDVLTFLNKLYKEQLLDPDFLNANGTDALAEKINKNIVGSTYGSISSYLTWDNRLIEAGISDAKYEPLVPFSLISSGEAFIEVGGSAVSYYCISNDASDPELAIKWMDYVYASEEGHRLTTWGIEGLTYNLENGKPEYTEFVYKNPEGKSSAMAMWSIGMNPTVAPFIKSDTGPWSGHLDSMNRVNPENKRMSDKIRAYGKPAVYIGPVTEDENKTLQSVEQLGLTTYRDEMLAKFIFGDVSLDKFGDYVNRMNQLGLENFMRVHQAAYERVNKK